MFLCQIYLINDANPKKKLTLHNSLKENKTL